MWNNNGNNYPLNRKHQMSHDRLQNPADFRLETVPPFEHDSYEDELYDEVRGSLPASITYEGFYYDGALRITKLEVTTKAYEPLMSEQLTERISLRNNGKRIVLECKPEYK